jgi:hypothetical protein
MSFIFCIENILYRVEKGSGDFSPTNNNVWEAHTYLQIKSWGGAKASTSRRSSEL